MRVTQNIVFGKSTVGIQNQYQRMVEVQQQATSGSLIQRPGDNPSGSFRHMIFQTELAGVESLVRTTNLATNRLSAAESRIATVYDKFLTAQETLLQMGNDYHEEESTMNAISEQVRSLFDDILLEVNGTLDGAALFGGGRSQVPYDETQVKTTGVMLRGGGEGGMVRQDAAAASVTDLDTTHANYPGSKTSVRLTALGGNQFEVMVNGDPDPASPATLAGGVVDLGWAKFNTTASPAAGDEYFFQVVPEYQGGRGDRDVKTAEGLASQGNISGKELVEGENNREVNLFEVLAGMQGALRRTDAKELSAWQGQLDTALDQINDLQAVTGLRINRVESAKSTLEMDQDKLKEASALNKDADMFEVLTKLEQYNQSMQVITMSERIMLSTSVIDLIK